MDPGVDSLVSVLTRRLRLLYNAFIIHREMHMYSSGGWRGLKK